MPGNQISHVTAHPAFEGDDGHSSEPPCCVWFSAHDPLFQRKKVPGFSRRVMEPSGGLMVTHDLHGAKGIHHGIELIRRGVAPLSEPR